MEPRPATASLLGSCAGACQGDCTCVCTNVVGDPKANVAVKTKGDGGQLERQDAGLDLGSYAVEPVSVRLDDGDSQPIAARSVGALPPAGKSGTMWRFTSKADGLQQVKLKSLGAKHPGMFQLLVKAKRWFSAGAANDAAANTSPHRHDRRSVLHARGDQEDRLRSPAPPSAPTASARGCQQLRRRPTSGFRNRQRQSEHGALAELALDLDSPPSCATSV